MTITLDFSVLSNVNPYVPPAGFTGYISQFKISAGNLLPVWTAGPNSFLRNDNPNTTGLLEVVWSANQSSAGGSDKAGAIFVNSSGTGFLCRIFYDILQVVPLTAWVIGSNIQSVNANTWPSGGFFRATFDKDIGELKFYNQLSPGTPVIHRTSLAIPAGVVSNGICTNWDNSGAAGFISAEFSSVATSSVDSYPATVRSGQTGIAYTTTGLSAVSGITVGSLAATSLSDTSGDGTHAIPGLVDGVAHQLYGTKTVIITGTGGAPTTTTDFLPPVDWDFVPLAGTLNTSETGVLHDFSPAALVTDQIVFDPASGAVDAQGNFIGTPGPPQIMWHIQASTEIARSYLVITSATSTATNKITGSKITGSRITGSKITGSKI